MRELSLFSGAGGGLLGTHLLGWEPVGYVEFNDYCQRVIAQRIADGILPVAPIFGDIRTFLSEGCAELYRGVTDIVTGGFPCQPFSVAGKRAGADDERNMWPATIECIRMVRPRYCLLENVPGILSSGYFGTILGDLAESGYDARWRILSAAELGAPHKRDRLWIVAHTSSAGTRMDDRRASRGSRQRWQPTHAPQPAMVRQEHRAHRAEGINASSADVAYADSQRQQKQWRGIANEPQQPATKCSGENVGNATSAGLPNWRVASVEQSRTQSQPQRPTWWEVEPPLGRVVDGHAGRVDELKAIGNAQVPLCAAFAFLLLAGGES